MREIIGKSRLGRSLEGIRLGHGALQVSLIAGCHGDEPVGPAWLSAFVREIEEDGHPLLEQATFRIVPCANPDGHAANERWWRGGAGAGDLSSYLAHRVRELPGDDLEFGFPGGEQGDDGIRPEALAIAGFLAEDGPVHVHGSLHGLGFGAGPWFLVEPAWSDRIAPYVEECLSATEKEGLVPHDVDRRGEKGFVRLGPGFCARPDSRAMRRHFLSSGDFATASLFRPSSMEFARSLGGDPFTFVTELPLFLQSDPADPRWPKRISRWTCDLSKAEREGRVEEGAGAVENEARLDGICPLPVEAQKRLVGVQVHAAIRLAERERRARA